MKAQLSFLLEEMKAQRGFLIKKTRLKHKHWGWDLNTRSLASDRARQKALDA